jgi:ATP synthase protein I
MGRAAEAAWEAAISMVLGAVIGIFLDRRAGTSPFLLVLFLVLGMVVGVRRLLRLAKEETEAAAARPEPPRADREIGRDSDEP